MFFKLSLHPCTSKRNAPLYIFCDETRNFYFLLFLVQILCCAQSAVITRLVNGFHSIRQAVRSAPEVWTAMLIRMLLRREVHKFLFDVFTAFAIHSRSKVPEKFWLCLSRFLHYLEKQQELQDSSNIQ